MTDHPLVGIAMGSSSDLPTLEPAIEVLTEFGIPHEVRVLSAHRTPDRMSEYARTAHERGLKVIIAGAGGAAHLPGMIAASTPLPVIGVPVNTSSGTIGGIDALLSIAQMPRGVPVATVAIGGGMNAGILAAQIVAAADMELLQRIVSDKASLAEKVLEQDQDIQQR
jgi:phosphoribosylaminoimidazole carboxylase PurE protein